MKKFIAAIAVVFAFGLAACPPPAEEEQPAEEPTEGTVPETATSPAPAPETATSPAPAPEGGMMEEEGGMMEEEGGMMEEGEPPAEMPGGQMETSPAPQ